jgi:hypothetical protein
VRPSFPSFAIPPRLGQPGSWGQRHREEGISGLGNAARRRSPRVLTVVVMGLPPIMWESDTTPGSLGAASTPHGGGARRGQHLSTAAELAGAPVCCLPIGWVHVPRARGSHRWPHLSTRAHPRFVSSASTTCIGDPQ